MFDSLAKHVFFLNVGCVLLLWRSHTHTHTVKNTVYDASHTLTPVIQYIDILEYFFQYKNKNVNLHTQCFIFKSYNLKHCGHL